jgi:radical SAM superfamily enzyme YgiQ (UPF0313 family)
MFCPVYKDREFSVRPLEHIIRDIDYVHEYVEFLQNPRDDFAIEEPLAYDMAMRWTSHRMKSVFLQDADSLAIGSENLSEVLNHLRERFPTIERVTSYARSSTINKMSSEELNSLHQAGLTRIHVGLESGSDSVLKMVRKGASKAIHVQAGLKVKESGMELSEYFMPGLGGKSLSEEHAVESADALNQIDPDFIRLRPLAFPVRAPLYQLMVSDQFDKCNDIDIVRELVTFIEHIDGVSSYLVSDHILNLFADLRGRIPADKSKMLSILKRFLNLDEDEQMLYRFARRLGAFTSLDDLEDESRRTRIKQIMSENNVNRQNIDSLMDQMMQRFM